MPLISPTGRPDNSRGYRALFICVVIVTGLVSRSLILSSNLNWRWEAAEPSASVDTSDDVLPPNIPAPPAIFAEVPLSDNHATLVDLPPPVRPADSMAVAESALQVQSDSKPPSHLPPPAGDRNPTDLGLIICEPVTPSSTPTSVSDFGIAAGDWLNLIAAGQPELGRTPEPQSISRIEFELKSTDMRLLPQQARLLASIVGVTDVACGSISGSTNNVTLSYQLYAVPTLIPIGSALTVTGSLQQVDDALPSMAKQLDTEVGLTKPDIPNSTLLSPDNLSTLGAFTHTANVAPDDIQTVSSLSEVSPLAGFYLLPTRAMDDSALHSRTVSTLLSQVPQNALVLDEISNMDPSSLQNHYTETEELCRKYQQSALISHVDVLDQRQWGDPITELHAALRLIHDSPNDPDSWLTLSETSYNIAYTILHDRAPIYLTDSESKVVQPLYRLSEIDDKIAAHLDARDGHAWYELSSNAAFADDVNTAIQTFNPASALDQHQEEADEWGIQLFQPKWDDDPTELYNVAFQAAQSNDVDAANATYIAGKLDDLASLANDNRYSDLKNQIVNNLIARYRKLIAQDPYNAWDHWDLAYVIDNETSNHLEAIKEFRIAEHLLPNAARLHYEFSSALDNQGLVGKEIDELRQAVLLDPLDTDARIDLAYEYKEASRYPEAATQCNWVIRLSPTNSDAYQYLGNIDEINSSYAVGLSEFEEAVNLNPEDAWAYFGICNCDDQLHHYKASLIAGRDALLADQASHKDNKDLQSQVFNTAADDYLNLKNWSYSLKASKLAQAINPNDMLALDNIAYAEWGEGDVDKARADWETVVVSNTDFDSADAKAALEKHFPGQ